jgi:hypothetical protein
MCPGNHFKGGDKTHRAHRRLRWQDRKHCGKHQSDCGSRHLIRVSHNRHEIKMRLRQTGARHKSGRNRPWPGIHPEPSVPVLTESLETRRQPRRFIPVRTRLSPHVHRDGNDSASTSTAHDCATHPLDVLNTTPQAFSVSPNQGAVCGAHSTAAVQVQRCQHGPGQKRLLQNELPKVPARDPACGLTCCRY